MLTRLRNGSWIFLSSIIRIRRYENDVLVYLAGGSVEEIVCDGAEAAQAYCDELAAQYNAAVAKDWKHNPPDDFDETIDKAVAAMGQVEPDLSYYPEETRPE